MSAADLHDRPAFQSVDQSLDFETKRVSRLAVAAFVAGLVSLLSTLSYILLPVALLAVILGVVAIIVVGRDSSLSGSALSYLGTGMGLVALASTVTYVKQRDSYLYAQAGSHAETFLDYLSREDKYYNALELIQSEVDRQITGTDLEQYYENLTTDVENAIESFLSDAGTKLVLGTKGNAQWKYQNGLAIWGNEASRYIQVEMRNEAPEGGEIVYVTMQRVTGLLRKDRGEPTAHWNVYQLNLP